MSIGPCNGSKIVKIPTANLKLILNIMLIMSITSRIFINFVKNQIVLKKYIFVKYYLNIITIGTIIYPNLFIYPTDRTMVEMVTV